MILLIVLSAILFILDQKIRLGNLNQRYRHSYRNSVAKNDDNTVKSVKIIIGMKEEQSPMV